MTAIPSSSAFVPNRHSARSGWVVQSFRAAKCEISRDGAARDAPSGLVLEYEHPESAIARRNDTKREMKVRCGKVESSRLRIQRTGMSTERRSNARLDRESALLRLRYHNECSVTPARNIV